MDVEIKFKTSFFIAAGAIAWLVVATILTLTIDSLGLHVLLMVLTTLLLSSGIAVSYREMTSEVLLAENRIASYDSDVQALCNAFSALGNHGKQETASAVFIGALIRQFRMEHGAIYFCNLLRREATLFYGLGAFPKKLSLETGVLATISKSAREPSFDLTTDIKTIYVPIVEGARLRGIVALRGDERRIQLSRTQLDIIGFLSQVVLLTYKNIEMMHDFELLNQHLEDQIIERTSKMRQTNSDMRSILHNIQLGICMISIDGKVHKEYSSHLEELLETTDIAGRDFIDVLFKHARVSRDDLDRVRSVFEIAIDDDVNNFIFNRDHLIDRVVLTLPSGKSKYLDLSWDPVLQPNTTVVAKIMVSIRDITAVSELEERAETQSREMYRIARILGVERRAFDNFISGSRAYMDSNRRLLEQPNLGRQDLQTVMGNIHTIKGNARTMAFDEVSTKAHEIESTLAAAISADHRWIEEVRIPLLALLQELNGLIEEYRRVFDERLRRFLTGQTVVETRTVATFGEVVSQIRSWLPPLAAELRKPQPLLHARGEDVPLSINTIAIVADVFGHLVRNAMDHGIEPESERIAIGKTVVGSIYLKAERKGSGPTAKLHIDVSDDGRGLDLASIRRIALERAIILDSAEYAPADIAEIIFDPGFSTSEAVTEISGRGIGMTAVREALRRHGGEIQVVLLERNSQGRIGFRLAIEVPAEIAQVLPEPLSDVA